MGKPMRRNLAHLSPQEQQAFVNAIRQIDLIAFSDGVSYWDKQDQIHQGTHNHGGNSFIPWHREFCNRLEQYLQQVDPSVALHYWDWTENPRTASDGTGGTVNLCTDQLMGTASGVVAGTLAPLHNSDVEAGSRGATGNPADPPRVIRRNCPDAAPPIADDNTIITSADNLPPAQQWNEFRQVLEGHHGSAHGYFGPGSTILAAHSAFEDPFVFLLHCNVDRLFAMWQTVPGQEWRLDEARVYGDQSLTNDSRGILHNLQPWDGTVEFGQPIEPWTQGSSAIEVKNCRHPSVVAPPCYDTLPWTIAQVSPDAGDPIRFLDVITGDETSRAFRLRVRGCHQITCQAELLDDNGLPLPLPLPIVGGGDTGFTLLASSGTSPEPEVFETNDLLVWVVFTAGAPNSTASATLRVTVAETGDVFTVPIVANVIPNPTVATSLVLDRSASMDQASGVAALRRIEILRNSAPLFVELLDNDDGIGVVRFDTDAAEAEPIQVAGDGSPTTGRSEALGAISNHTTNPNGWTAIGDGIEAAVAQLAAGGGGFQHQATVVFTDGHETEEKYIEDVADLVNSRTYAIGLGTAEQLNPGALDDLVKDTGGYLLLTGNPGPDDELLLQKYFAQVLAGVANNQIVVDPDGFVPPGGHVKVPYDMTEGDRQSEVIILSPGARALEVAVEAPDGTTFALGSPARVVRNDRFTIVKVPSLDPDKMAGEWLVHLEVDEGGLKEWLEELKKREDLRTMRLIRSHGVPFSVTVQARSTVRLGVAIAQTSRRPGTKAKLTATLTQSGIPLGFQTHVWTEITHPDDTTDSVVLAENKPGVYTGEISTPTQGVYRLLTHAKGRTLRGSLFTRRELRTVAAWSRGDDLGRRPDRDKSDVDVGRLITCLLDDEGLISIAKKHGIDLHSIRRCVQTHG